uniref:Uncharacterized protein n=1 Tax=Moniliophthora roreri TaxID=221103 RepID=A0A0W0GBJ4_MONRR
MGRLYESSSSSESQHWITLASAYRNAAIQVIRSRSLDPNARFMTFGCLSVYTISLSLSSPSSSPKYIFSLVTLLHNIYSPVKQLVYADPWLQSLGYERPGPPIAPPALDSSTSFFASLYHLCDTSMAFGSDREELDDPDIKGAYQTAVHGLYVMDSLVQRGLEGRSAFFWPALFGKRFLGLLNERRQRALVILYYYLLMLENLSERCWWASEAKRWAEYVYGLIDERWRGWLREVTTEKARIVNKKKSSVLASSYTHYLS